MKYTVKEKSVLLIFLALFHCYLYAGDFSFGGLLLGNKRVNIAVGALESSNVDARSKARNGGRAVAGAVVADQNTASTAGALNISAGVLKRSYIRAKASADGQNAKAYAGGVVSTAEPAKAR